MATPEKHLKRAYGRSPAAAHARRMKQQKLRRAAASINANRRPNGKQRSKISCRDLAKASGLSRMTVSRYLPEAKRTRKRHINHNEKNTYEQQRALDISSRLYGA